MATKQKKSVKRTVKTTSKRVVAPKKVDYYPNRMTLAVSALAGTLLVLLGLIAALGSRGWQ